MVLFDRREEGYGKNVPAKWSRLTKWVIVGYVWSLIAPILYLKLFWGDPLRPNGYRSWRANEDGPISVVWAALLPGWLWLANVLRMCRRPSAPPAMTKAGWLAFVLLWLPLQVVSFYVGAPLLAPYGYLLLSGLIVWAVVLSYRLDRFSLNSSTY